MECIAPIRELNGRWVTRHLPDVSDKNYELLYSKCNRLLDSRLAFIRIDFDHLLNIIIIIPIHTDQIETTSRTIQRLARKTQTTTISYLPASIIPKYRG